MLGPTKRAGAKEIAEVDAPPGSYLRLVDSCITQLKAQGPSRNCDESNKEEEEDQGRGREGNGRGG